MMLVSVAMLVALYAGLTRTRVGLVIRAALSRPDMVEALGHNVPRVFMLVFGGGAALAGLAGVIGGNAFVTEPGMAAALGPDRLRGRGGGRPRARCRAPSSRRFSSASSRPSRSPSTTRVAAMSDLAAWHPCCPTSSW